LRQWAGIRAHEWAYGQAAIVATVAHEKPHRNVAIEHFLPAGPFAILPMTATDEAPHRSSLVWTETAAEAPRVLALDEDRFAAELARRFGDHWGWVRPVGARFSYPLGLLWAERTVAMRLALVGDALHVIHPIAGQGLNLGIRDAAALAEVLMDARRLGLDIGSGEPLARYAARRRVDTALLSAATDGLNRLFSNSLAPVAAARRLGLAAVDRMPPVKRFLMRHAMGIVGDLPRLARGERL
ncbi:MAG: FAD-dependent monooxygenase, partial [Alphaproteobacteria bacterium]